MNDGTKLGEVGGRAGRGGGEKNARLFCLCWRALSRMHLNNPNRAGVFSPLLFKNHVLRSFCRGSQINLTRLLPDQRVSTLTLSTLHLTYRSDGNHAGAAAVRRGTRSADPANHEGRYSC